MSSKSRTKRMSKVRTYKISTTTLSTTLPSSTRTTYQPTLTNVSKFLTLSFSLSSLSWVVAIITFLSAFFSFICLLVLLFNFNSKLLRTYLDVFQKLNYFILFLFINKIAIVSNVITLEKILKYNQLIEIFHKQSVTLT